jgi:hypothetical protein
MRFFLNYSIMSVFGVIFLQQYVFAQKSIVPKAHPADKEKISPSNELIVNDVKRLDCKGVVDVFLDYFNFTTSRNSRIIAGPLTQFEDTSGEVVNFSDKLSNQSFRVELKELPSLGLVKMNYRKDHLGFAVIEVIHGHRHDSLSSSVNSEVSEGTNIETFTFKEVKNECHFFNYSHVFKDRVGLITNKPTRFTYKERSHRCLKAPDPQKRILNFEHSTLEIDSPICDLLKRQASYGSYGNEYGEQNDDFLSPRQDQISEKPYIDDVTGLLKPTMQKKDEVKNDFQVYPSIDTSSRDPKQDPKGSNRMPLKTKPKTGKE